MFFGIIRRHIILLCYNLGMDYFPFFFDLRGRRVLIAGGGEVARRKAALLARAGAMIVAVAPKVSPDLAAIVAEARRKNYAADDLDGAAAAIAATNDDALNRRVSEDARARKIPVNVVDCPALSDFIFPAIVSRPPMTAAISSGGASPVLARSIRAKVEELLPPRLGRAAELFAGFRGQVQQRLPFARRRHFWERALEGTAAQMALSGEGDDDGRRAQLQKELDDFVANREAAGEVYLIGAGPGAADLMTFRAHRFLQRADAVVHDRLVSAEVLDLARRDADIIYAGKRRGQHALSQDEINALLIRLARRGLKVARLKGGDPFVFGRGGEEAQAMRAAGVPVFVVPGITAASGCAAAAGIPLTHRRTASGVRFYAVCNGEVDFSPEKESESALESAAAFKGESDFIKKEESESELKSAADEKEEYWRQAAATSDTLVFYMAAAKAAAIARRLIAAGKNANTPAVAVCAGTTAAQKIVRADLSAFAARQTAALMSPALLIVGEVAALGADDSAVINHAAALSDFNNVHAAAAKSEAALSPFLEKPLPPQKRPLKNAPPNSHAIP